MSLPTSLSAYRTEQDAFDTAMTGAKGARLKLGTYEACVGFRTRLHYFRTLDRRANADTYPKGHPQHGQSVYDDYSVRIIPDEDGEYWIYIEKRSSAVLAIELLDEDDGLIDAPTIDGEAHEIHQIEDHTNDG